GICNSSPCDVCSRLRCPSSSGSKPARSTAPSSSIASAMETRCRTSSAPIQAGPVAMAVVMRPTLAWLSRRWSHSASVGSAMRAASLIAALFQQPLHLAVDQPESGLFHQWQLPAPTTDVVEVDVDDQQLLTALVRGGHDVAPR